MRQYNSQYNKKENIFLSKHILFKNVEFQDIISHKCKYNRQSAYNERLFFEKAT